ncbi:hypothetical protein [uncultured Maribacter sp.]|uniref:hypothetical protein n=1 Tax=uncultured Maribacter sp. TaxID=431308 RepID=UPI002634188D|nr:hypothetical protein [uncultured Maribacter sp.]
MKKFVALCIIICLSQMGINAQEITMVPKLLKTEYYEGDKEISNKELKAILEKDVKAFGNLKKSETFSVLSWVALASEIGFVTYGIANKDVNNPTINTGAYTSFGGVLVFSALAYIQKNKAIKKYNQGLSKPTVFSIMPSKTGLGIVMQF